jgi:hypothetical protein
VRTAAFKPAHQCRVSPRFRVAAFWRKISTNKKVRCEEGDPLGRIIQNIMDQVIIGALEPVANGMVDALNAILVPTIGWLGFNKIGRICHTPDYEPDRCNDGALTLLERAALSQCFDESKGLQELCFFERV